MGKPLILVTGATGTTGKLVVRELLRRDGARVRAGVRSIEKARALLPDGAEAAVMDYRRPETVDAAMQGASALYLLTPGGSEQVEQAWVAVEAARRAGVARIVRLGSLQAQETGPTTQVERWCKMTEQMVERSGIAWTFLRPSCFNQDFTELYFAPQVKAGFLAAPMGEGRAAWVDCRDVAAVAASALLDPGHEGKAYTLTGPAVLGVREIVSLLSRAAGRTIRYFDSPELPQRLFVKYVLGMPQRDVSAMLELIGKLRDGHLTHCTDDVEKVLGRPPIGFAEFAMDHAAMLRR
jgi:uncharacterized protein YbjT (DUF2867 family)